MSVLVPAVWVAYEYLHSIGSASFPWLHLGYTQYEVAPVLQLAALGGVYAASAFILLAAYAVFHLFAGRAALGARLRAVTLAALVLYIRSGRDRRTPFALAAGSVFLVFLGLAAGFHQG